MIERTDDDHIPPYLKAISVLEPEGSAAAEVAAEFEKWRAAGVPPHGQQHEHSTPDVNVSKLEGTYRRRYDGAALGIGKTDSISFTADGRFQERGFLTAALGSRILPNGSVVFFESEAGGEGTSSLRHDTLELNYASNSYSQEHQVGRGVISLSFYPLDRMPGTNVVAAAIFNTHYTFVRLSTQAEAETSSAASTDRPDPRDAEPFIIEEYQPYYHPRHSAFFIQFLGGVVFFTHVPGTNLNASVRINDIPPGRWSTFTSGGGDTIPVTLCREGATFRGRWL